MRTALWSQQGRRGVEREEPGFPDRLPQFLGFDRRVPGRPGGRVNRAPKEDAIDHEYSVENPNRRTMSRRLMARRILRASFDDGTSRLSRSRACGHFPCCSSALGVQIGLE